MMQQQAGPWLPDRHFGLRAGYPNRPISKQIYRRLGLLPFYIERFKWLAGLTAG